MTKISWSAEVIRPKAKAVFVDMPASATESVNVSHQDHYGRKLTLEEVDRLVSDKIACEVLSQVHAADNEGAVEVSALEQFDVGWWLGRCLELNDTTHHSDSLTGFDPGPTS